MKRSKRVAHRYEKYRIIIGKPEEKKEASWVYVYMEHNIKMGLTEI
jgi:hypothetical protein